MSKLRARASESFLDEVCCVYHLLKWWRLSSVLTDPVAKSAAPEALWVVFPLKVNKKCLFSERSRKTEAGLWERSWKRSGWICQQEDAKLPTSLCWRHWWKVNTSSLFTFSFRLVFFLLLFTCANVNKKKNPIVCFVWFWWCCFFAHKNAQTLLQDSIRVKRHIRDILNLFTMLSVIYSKLNIHTELFNKVSNQTHLKRLCLLFTLS